MNLSPEDLDMLRTYEHGHPWIWDVASFMPSIGRLIQHQLIEPVVPDDPNDANTTYHVDYDRGKACRITDKGRQVLTDEPVVGCGGVF